MSWLDRRRPQRKFSNCDTRGFLPQTTISISRQLREWERSRRGQPSYLVPLPATAEEWRSAGFTYIGSGR